MRTTATIFQVRHVKQHISYLALAEKSIVRSWAESKWATPQPEHIRGDTGDCFDPDNIDLRWRPDFRVLKNWVCARNIDAWSVDQLLKCISVTCVFTSSVLYLRWRYLFVFTQGFKLLYFTLITQYAQLPVIWKQVFLRVGDIINGAVEWRRVFNNRSTLTRRFY